MAHRNTVDVWSSDDRDFSENLSDFLGTLSAIASENAEHAESLTIHWEAEDGYYGDSSSFRIWINRLETEDEAARRESAEEEARRERFRKQHADQEALQRRAYEALKAKYEPNS